ncbi:TonB-dependent hemoglobin/transferrin/lactoferrin family receptor [Mangrovibrevibacter kandeliae]|uniref:TonB-dependent hemoglobin/transferrin/lactoferrin family receptor n=1 Tax=Mangrovibrevibacter kandeliae TaxID=2968473 RepID=UPI002118AED3|nr:MULTISPECIES: TonB-dependent hemoglobin/transferrin/lactoferrin family receptor [unclassified Aurantimonas]MCQ8781575.1 TonB-dependent hemoglobin/transferrin/lactoferrin family receptor [Aurantimonas sp. CSK15Z-1]MCW4114349.1 TonB-dependent hemoglobin/transferrin/lactoferrin family receptor [Aurantimonas sp. MSK8Z-1]
MTIDHGRGLRIATSALLLACGSSAARAQSPGDDAGADGAIPLQTVVIQGGTPAKITGASVVTVDKAELDDKQVQSLEELGQRIDPSVDFNPSSDSVNIRGLDGSRVLTTIDGVPILWLNEPIYGAAGGISTFDFDSLAQVDILKGADSSRYGSGALGGILGLRTLDPDDLIEPGRTWGGLSTFTYDSRDTDIDVSQAVAARYGGTSVLLQGGGRWGNEVDNQGDVGGTGTTRTEPNPVDYDQYNWLGKIYQEVEGGHRFGFTAERYKRTNEIDALTNIGSTYSDLDTEEQRERTRLSLSYDYEGDGSAWLDEAYILGYWLDTKIGLDDQSVRLTTPIGAYGRTDTLEKMGFGGHADAQKQLALGGFSNTLRFGADVFGGESTQYLAGDDACSIVFSYSCSFFHVNQSYQPDVDSRTFGGFLEDDVKLGGGFTLTPGVRFDWYDHEPKETASYEDNDAAQDFDENTDSQLSGKLRGAYDWDGGRVYAQWAQGFRAPTSDELFTTYGSSTTYLNIGNPDLKPETSNSFEVGTLVGDEALGVGATAFTSSYRNFIDTETFTAADLGLTGYPFGVFAYINRAHVRIQGIEANAHWQFYQGWKASVALALVRGRDTDMDETIDSIPPYRGIFDLAYQAETWGGGATWTVAGKRDDVGLHKGYTSGYGLLDLRASWTPDEVKGLKLTAGVFNLFDQTYYNALHIPSTATSLPQPDEFYSEAGRTFKVTAAYKF